MPLDTAYTGHFREMKCTFKCSDSVEETVLIDLAKQALPSFLKTMQENLLL